MTSNQPPLPVRTARTTRTRFAWHHFAMRFSSTPRGARLARHLAGVQRHGITPTSSDPGVASVFATQAERFGDAIVEIYPRGALDGSRSTRGTSRGRPNGRSS